MRYLKILVLGTTVCTFSCTNSADGQQSKDKGGYTISGKIKNAGTGNVVLEELNPQQGFVPKDTAKVGQDGKFTFTGKVAEPTVYRLNIAEKGGMLLVVENKSIQIEADAANQLASATFKGSPESEKLAQLNKSATDAQKKMQRLGERFQANQANPDSVQYLQSAYQTSQEQMGRQMKSFVRKNLNSTAGAFAAANVVNPAEDMAFADSVYTALNKNLPNSQYTKQLGEKVKQAKQREAAMASVAIGQVAPNIVLTSPEGKEIPLSSLKGKYVLLDFWASWCGPCRRENPNVVRTYNQYKDKGFTIYSVSLDQSKDKWVQAIKDDNLTWPNHVSDLLGWQSSAAALYKVDGIPATFLLDKEGKIIAKNLRGSALEEKLATLMK